MDSDGRFTFFHSERRRLNKWSRRLPLLATLIRIRKAPVQALCEWDLTNNRPDTLKVINTNRDRTGLTVEQATEV